jgi:curved DNA-binding protein CbpA
MASSKSEYRIACETLGLPYTHTKDQLKQQYRLLAKQFHPDRNSDPDANNQFRKIQAAYKFLLETNQTNQTNSDDENPNTILRDLILKTTRQYSVFPNSDKFFESIDYELLLDKIKIDDTEFVTKYLGDKMYEHISQQLASTDSFLGSMARGLFGVLFG